ncbi:MAG: hypothetical protein Q8O56_13995 [Solirubrobacteraceae bacterium]|nr:hypothetical protein [Solirubrobacteraceae bacterium]
MPVLTRKEQLLDAFREAGKRGLTGLEMQGVVGVFWRLRLRELQDDGVVFREDASKVAHPRGGRHIFRWVLVYEPPPAADDDDAGTPALFEAPPPPPASAIGGEPPC